MASVEPFQVASTTSSEFLKCEKFYLIKLLLCYILWIYDKVLSVQFSHLDQNALTGTLPDLSNLDNLQTL